jgi:hypothetical protein
MLARSGVRTARAFGAARTAAKNATVRQNIPSDPTELSRASKTLAMAAAAVGEQK